MSNGSEIYKKMLGTMIDDRHEVFRRYESQCAFCKHFEELGYCCEAFPAVINGKIKGIPFDILSGEATHEKIRKNQVGQMVFEPNERGEKYSFWKR